MKPRIEKWGDMWYVMWRYPNMTSGHMTRRTYTWDVAIEQLRKLYAMGDVAREE